MNRRGLLRRGAGALAGAAAIGLRESAAAESQGAAELAGARRDAWIELDHRALAANFTKVKARAGGRPVMAVIKANAYGHGLVPVAQTLERAGVDSLLVTSTQEAMVLVQAGVSSPVLLFGRLMPADAAMVVEHGLQQMVDSPDVVPPLQSAAGALGKLAWVHVHVDTGMGRMGAPWRQADAVVRGVASHPLVRIAGVSTALTEDPEFDRLQVQRLQEICARAGASGIACGRLHAASSAAVFADASLHLDMVRPGIALYGHYPSEGSRLRDAAVGLQPVMSMRARVVEVKRMQPGDSVGYHRAWVAETAATVAVLPIGHSDGYPPQAAAAGGHAWIAGHACPFIGGVDANHCKVLLPEGLTIVPGEVATLFGGAEGAPSADQVATWAGTSVYQMLMRVNPTLPRTAAGETPA